MLEDLKSQSPFPARVCEAKGHTAQMPSQCAFDPSCRWHGLTASVLWRFWTAFKKLHVLIFPFGSQMAHDFHFRLLRCWHCCCAIHRRTQASLCALWMVVGICSSRSGQLHGPVSSSSVFEASPQKSQKKMHTWKCFSASHVEIKVGEICFIWPDVLLLHESGPQCFCHYKSWCKQLSCWCVPTSLGECYRKHFFSQLDGVCRQHPSHQNTEMSQWMDRWIWYDFKVRKQPR